jgi:hypothetical protein
MRHFEQVGASDAMDELRFRFPFDVAGQKRGETSGADLDDDRAVVLCCPTEPMPRHVRGHRHRPDPTAVAFTDNVNRDVAFDRGREELAGAIAAELSRRDP